MKSNNTPTTMNANEVKTMQDIENQIRLESFTVYQ